LPLPLLSSVDSFLSADPFLSSQNKVTAAESLFAPEGVVSASSLPSVRSITSSFTDWLYCLRLVPFQNFSLHQTTCK
jgi:hypothetical protein